MKNDFPHRSPILKWSDAKTIDDGATMSRMLMVFICSSCPGNSIRFFFLDDDNKAMFQIKNLKIKIKFLLD